jgi:hypothetical protein
MQFSTPLFLVFACLLPLEGVQAAPHRVYLTWQGDSGTTMTVNYHTREHGGISQVYYDTVSCGDPAAYAFRADGESHRIEGLKTGSAIHWVELRDLEPGATYYFVAGDAENGFSPEYRFRTIPDDDRSLRFLVGGDMEVGSSARALLAQAGRREPQFVVLGGDLAYVNGKLKDRDKWQTWFDNWQANMTTPSGYMVPMVLTIGNHEVSGGYGQTPAQAPFYFAYFAQAGPQSYYVRRFGRNVILYVLDSGHVAAHGGEQAAWLEAEMQRSEAVPYRFAAYHVPLYPGYRSYKGKHSQQGRQHWLPLFDRYQLTTAFEHHDHVLKRSKILRHNQVAEKGTLYLGDGCMGKTPRWVYGPRREDRRRRWYLEKVARKRHFWQVDVDRERVVFQAVDKDGQVVDRYALEREVPAVMDSD